ncbi:LysR family transcriptional regulator [Shewanella maritima]|uniref:LysR family transcriptional regulator n=1 Tax=Shewanella maritima TaxID=2520507 RepID=UPI0013EEBE20|nr:LysR family transcriptional regulator [Shewanella maritima]
MNINDLELFIAVAKLGSFSKAADSFDTRRALVSRRIGELEKQLGAPLFIRTTRAMSLTPSGEQFLEQVEPLVGQFLNAARMVENQQSQLQGKLRIGLLPFMERLLDRQIAEFMRKHPQIKLEIFMVSGGYRELTRLGLDFVIDVGKLEDSSFVAKKLTSFKLKLFATPEYLAQHDEITCVEDLAQHSMIASTGGTIQNHIMIDDQTFSIDYSLITNDFSSLFSFCLAGAGIAFLPYSLVTEHLENQQLVSILPEIESDYIDSYLVYPSRQHMSLAAKMFASNIIDVAQELDKSESAYYSNKLK